MSQVAEQPSETTAESKKSFSVPRQAQTAESPNELPPAVLVFRDGHEEEIAKYSIMGSTIYVSNDHWSGGSWTRKVQITDLDVPTTVKVNQERGANFALPSGRTK